MPFSWELRKERIKVELVGINEGVTGDYQVELVNLSNEKFVKVARHFLFPLPKEEEFQVDQSRIASRKRQKRRALNLMSSLNTKMKLLRPKD